MAHLGEVEELLFKAVVSGRPGFSFDGNQDFPLAHFRGLLAKIEGPPSGLHGGQLAGDRRLDVGQLHRPARLKRGIGGHGELYESFRLYEDRQCIVVGGRVLGRRGLNEHHGRFAVHDGQSAGLLHPPFRPVAKLLPEIRPARNPGRDRTKRNCRSARCGNPGHEMDGGNVGHGLRACARISEALCVTDGCKRQKAVAVSNMARNSSAVLNHTNWRNSLVCSPLTLTACPLRIRSAISVSREAELVASPSCTQRTVNCRTARSSAWQLEHPARCDP